MLSAQAQTVPPDPPKFDAQQSPTFVGISDLYEYKALPEYHEPAWVTAKFVDTGDTAASQGSAARGTAGLQDRRPCPMVRVSTATLCATSSAASSQGWNFLAGAQQGWGGIDTGMYECLTRTGPLFTVKAEELSTAAEPGQELGMVG